MNYPFIPKSTSHLEPGQYWPIPLSNGRYGCGVVLAKLQRDGKSETRVFYAGLLQWCSKLQPNADTIKNCGFVKKGALHIKAIISIGSEITGKADFKDLPPNPSEYTYDIVTMGYDVINIVAEKQFAAGS